MTEKKDIETTRAFYEQLFTSSKYVMLSIVCIFALQIAVLPLLEDYIAKIILTLVALFKVILIVRLTFNQLAKIIGQTHLLIHVLVLFGLLITIILLTFAVDYYSLYGIDPSSFKISNTSNVGGFKLFFEMFYFSTITFSSVGFGDIVPTTMLAKSAAMLQIALRFFVLVFGIANINQIKIDR